jgi:O-antigen ligase
LKPQRCLAQDDRGGDRRNVARQSTMTDSAVVGPRADTFDRPGLARVADGVAAAVAASLPWSTSATGILLAIWFVTLVPTLDAARLRREIATAAGGAPLILVALAALGMLWASVGMSQRLDGLEGFLKLLFIPLLLAQFRGSSRGWWVILSFFGASVALLVASWGLALIPGLPWRGKMVGIPVKDYITQSGIFALCAFALLDCAAQAWRHRRRQLALAFVFSAAAFVANIAFVETGRTTLVTIAVLVPIFGFRQFGWRGMAVAGIVGCVFAGGFWMSSSYLRERVTHVVEEVDLYRTEHLETSSGQRLEYWTKSIEAIAKAPVLGNGTGSIPQQLASTVSRETGVVSFGTVNPHNQILVVAIQLGLIGTIALLVMWIAHLLLFRGAGLISWIGLVAVVQNMVGSLFNSHLGDFTQGWIYVFAVGALGGMALRQATPWPADGGTALPAPATDWRPAPGWLLS